MKELFSFYKNALSDGLCEEYKGYWRAASSDKERLITLAMCQQSIPFVATYCYQGRGVSLNFLKSEFSDYINKSGAIRDADGVHGYTYSMWVGKNGVLAAADDVLHLMWCKPLSLSIKAAKCPNIYISNKSDVSIVCNGYNSPRIYLFDESRVTMEDVDENSEIVVYKYSNVSEVVKGKYCLGTVKTFNKELRL